MTTQLSVDPALLPSCESTTVTATIDSVTSKAVTLLVGDKVIGVAVPAGGFEGLKAGNTGTVTLDVATGASSGLSIAGVTPPTTPRRRSSPEMPVRMSRVG